MKCTNRIKGKRCLLLILCLLAVILAGCGQKEDPGKDEDNKSVLSPTSDEDEGREKVEETEGREDGTTDENEDGPTESVPVGERTVEPLPELTEEELASLQYIEKNAIEDYYGDHTEYQAYVPIGTQIEDGLASYFGHGLTYHASAANFGFDDLLEDYAFSSLEFDLEEWENVNSGYRDVKISEITRCGEDSYHIAAVMNDDLFGTPYSVKKVYYLDRQAKGAGISWSLEVYELGVDEETNAVIDELARCYRINLDDIKTDGEWQAGDDKRREELQDEYEPREGDLVLEKVDGYQYMGLTYLSDTQGKVQCPVMVPMGRETSAQESYVRAHMHGVAVSGGVESLYGRDFLSRVQSGIDDQNRLYENYPDEYANAQTSAAQPIPGFDMARYAILTYDQLQYGTDEFLPRAKILCYIKFQEDYILSYSITLYFEEYDSSTTTLIKELEVAYGIDLSEFYYESI